MLMPSPNHGTHRLPNDDDDDDEGVGAYFVEWCSVNFNSYSYVTHG